MSEPTATPTPIAWHRRARQAFGTSIKLRMVLVFLLLAAAMTTVFVGGAQKAFSLGWREAARPLLMDYVDHLVADIMPSGTTPRKDAALALTQRLPLTVRISGPQVNWASHPEQIRADRQREHGNPPNTSPWDGERGHGDRDWQRILQRTTADGHTIEFGINEAVFERRQRLVVPAIAALLALTLLAWW